MSNNKKKYFYLRIYLSCFLLIGLTFLNTKIDIKNKISNNINFLNFTSLINNNFGMILPLKEKLVFSSNVYDQVTFNGKINHVINLDSNYVHSLTTGIVVKIDKNHNNGTYDITILSNDNYEYTYYNLSDFNLFLYSYVDENTILGIANQENNAYTFDLSIKKKGVYYNFYELCED